jgi:nonribosomal peptide synthetase DhbF
VLPDGPVILVGWSFGGTVAQRLATDLELSGRRPPLLVLLDAYHGADPGGEPGTAEFVRAALDGLSVPVATELDGNELRRALIARGSPLAALDGATLLNLVRLARLNHQAMSAHVPAPSRTPVLFVAAKTGSASALWRGLAEMETVQVGHDHDSIAGASAAAEVGALIARKVLDIVP